MIDSRVGALQHLAEHVAADRATRPHGNRPSDASRVSSVLAFDVLHDDARPLRIVKGCVVKGDGVGMLEAGHHQRFARKAFAEFGVGGDVVVHDLDDDLTAEVGLTRRGRRGPCRPRRAAESLHTDPGRRGPPWSVSIPLRETEPITAQV